MDEKSRQELEILAIEINELSDVIHVMWLGLQADSVKKEDALSCIHYMESGLIDFKERIEKLIHQLERA